MTLVVALQLWEESQLENERLRERLRGTNEELGKCKDQLDNAFQLVRSFSRRFIDLCVEPQVFHAINKMSDMMPRMLPASPEYPSLGSTY